MCRAARVPRSASPSRTLMPTSGRAQGQGGRVAATSPGSRATGDVAVLSILGSVHRFRISRRLRARPGEATSARERGAHPLGRDAGESAGVTAKDAFEGGLDIGGELLARCVAAGVAGARSPRRRRGDRLGGRRGPGPFAAGTAAAAGHLAEALHQRGRAARPAAVEPVGPAVDLALGADEHLLSRHDSTTPGRRSRLGVDLASSADVAAHGAIVPGSAGVAATGRRAPRGSPTCGGRRQGR